MKRSTLGSAIAAACLNVAISSPALAEDYLQFSTGVDYSSGDYGDVEDTEILSVPFAVKYNTDAFFIRASIPYLHVKGPGSVVPGDGGPIPGGTSGTVTSQDGIGDLSLSAGYSFRLADNTFFDVNGKVKLPTASESKRLGTGTTDFTAEAEIVQLFGPLSVSARGGRRFNGSSALFPLQDVWQAAPASITSPAT